MPGARQVLQRCLARYPGFAEGWSDLGTVQAMLGDRAAARKSWRRASQLDGKLVSARYNLAQLDLQSGAREAALRELERITAEFPKRADAWLGVGEVSLDLGEVSNARRAFEAASQLAPDDPRAWTGLAEAYLMANELGLARNAVNRAVQLEPGQPRIRLLQALVRAETETDPAALAAVDQELARLLPNPALKQDAAYGLGRVRLKQERPADAAVCFRAALDANPADLRARFQLARALLAAGRLDEGRREMRRYDRSFRLSNEIVSLRLRLETRPGDVELRRKLKALEAARAATW